MAKGRMYRDEPERRDVRLKSTVHDDVYNECERAKRNAIKAGKAAVRKRKG